MLVATNPVGVLGALVSGTRGAGVVTQTGAEASEVFPSASTASTMKQYWVSGSSPAWEKPRLLLVSTKEPLR